MVLYLSVTLEQIKQSAKYIRDKLYKIGDGYGIIGPNKIYNNDYYRKRKKDPWRSDAREVSRVLYDEFEPESVIDFGCAIGGHLEWFHEHGIEVCGIEGNTTAFEYSLIPNEYLEEHDLREPYEITKQRDLALCIEVAEHIPERYANQLVASLTDSAESVFFTAAPPGQQGTHHINLKKDSYWEKKFEEKGYIRDNMIETRLKQNLNLEKSTWIKDNMFVFVSGND
ncbi:hypothetical protein AArcSl_2953 [Halalkaliarchaeum desulfuricum]|uniref:Class I SAM-dependent methyltransferase n=1 Tax=Halalkaliarchaeum desulfuricum TaxID=2055893 RepID=A0A343TN92_9EURY|nr:methyltransferase domain-containing protein [Halalkaliarchaeum desulfuricum]AUX10564.1 hypothetical protein AArcSl_2953 [Halalkaliarchaeum desulfuricum]